LVCFFFASEPLLPIPIKSELINYLFFNNLKSAGTQTLIILTAFIIFFATFIVKFLLLKVLLLSLVKEPFAKKEDETQVFQRQKWRGFSNIKLQNTNVVTTVLIGNSLSYSVITAILLLRSK